MAHADGAADVSRGRHSPRWWIGWLLVLVVGLALALAPIPYTVFSAKPPREISTMLQVEGAPRPLSGTVLAARVGFRRATPLLAAWALLDADRAVLPEPDPDERRPTTGAAESFDDTIVAAAVVGLGRAGHEVVVEGKGLRVVGLAANRAVADVLRPGDVLLEAGGQPLVLASDLLAATADVPDGGQVSLRVRRGDQEQVVQATLDLHDPNRHRLEVTTVSIDARMVLPDGVSIAGLDDDALGGSAGLLLALSLFDRFADEPLLDGRTIGGTGAIDRDGGVHAIDGIAQKVRAAGTAGVEVFLAPASQADDARAAAPTGMTVLPVATVDEAIEALG